MTHRGRDDDELIRRYLDEIGRVPVLSPEDEVRLAQLKADGDNSAAQQLIKSKLRLVVTIARRYEESGVALLDLIQEGNLGLIQAVEKFDWRAGFNFDTYATWWIRQSISRGIANSGHNVKLDMADLAELDRVQQSWNRLVESLGRRPSIAELAADVGLAEDQVIEILGTPPAE